MLIFCQKIVHSLQNNLLSYPHIVNKMSVLSKTLCSHVIFLFKVFINPCCHENILSKVNSSKTTLFYGSKKSIRCLFCLCHGKTGCSYAKRPFSNKHFAGMVIFVKKRPFSQKHGGLMSFIQIFHEKFPAVMHYFVKIRQFCQNYDFLAHNTLYISKN